MSCSIITFASPLNAQDNILAQLLNRHPEYFKALLDAPDQYELQIIYTQINRDSVNHPSFKSYTYNVTSKRYFYPASTVKMPVAFLALEKINQLAIIGLDKHSPLKIGAARAPQTAVHIDSTAASLKPSIAHYIKKIFLVSDNDAFNRLYEFLGQAYINRQLRSKGFQHSRITHRLGAGGPSFNFHENQFTNPISFYQGDSLLYHQAEVHSQIPYQLDLQKELRGKGFYRNGELQEAPFDFGKKNFIALQDLHDMLQAVLFPEAVEEHRRFALSADDYAFLYQYLSSKPRESRYPAYEKPDGYVKFYCYGGTAEHIPDHIRIFNKVGWAYGYLSDVSYFADFEKNIEFMLAAVIHVNADGIYNDDQYEYETIGLPFFINLGNVIYDYEKHRVQAFQPDLSRFKLNYN